MKFEDIPEPIRTQMLLDELVFGNAYCLKTDGKYERIDPTKVVFKEDGTWEVIE